MLSRVSTYLGLALVLPLSLVACDDSSDSSDSGGSEQALNGHWIGGFEDSNGSYSVVGLTYEGRILLYAFNQGWAYDGSFSSSDGEWSAELEGFQGGQRFTTGQASGTYSANDFLDGEFSASNGSSGEAYLEYRDIYDNAADASTIGGTWMARLNGTNYSLTFGDNRSVTGSSGDGCNFTGSYSIPDQDKNLYELDVSQSCATGDIDWSGFGFIEPGGQGERDHLVLMLEDRPRYTLFVYSQ